MRTLVFESDDLKITATFGNSEISVVSFAGISFGLVDTGEFNKTLSQIDCDIYHVFDKKRKWYNGLHERLISDLLNKEIERRGSKAVFTLGNSMGGTGAIIFAAELKNCIRAISFCPQSSVHPDIVIFENRWMEYRHAILDWTVPDAIERMRSTREYIIFFGANDARDLNHADRFIRLAPNTVKVCTIPGCGHDVASYLKRSGMLAKVVRSLTEPNSSISLIMDIAPAQGAAISLNTNAGAVLKLTFLINFTE